MEDQVLVPSLHRKLIEVAKSVDSIEKRGFNEHFKYHFVTSNDMLNALRGKLYEQGVLLTGALEAVQTMERGTMILCRATVVWTFTDAETGETLSQRWEGWGIDSQDKALYKAYTGCLKTFLEKTFLVPTDADEPEKDQPATAKPGPQHAAYRQEKEKGAIKLAPPAQRAFFAVLSAACKEGSMKAIYMDTGQAGSDARKELRAKVLGKPVEAAAMTPDLWDMCRHYVNEQRQLWSEGIQPATPDDDIPF